MSHTTLMSAFFDLPAVYYLVSFTGRSTGTRMFIGPYGTGVSRHRAAQYATLSDVCVAVAKRGPEEGLTVTRCEETPGAEQRVVLGAVEEAVTVKYAVQFSSNNRTEWLKLPAARCNNVTALLDDAALFDSEGLALGALQDAALASGFFYLVEGVRRIALVPGKPTITETVLS